MIFAASDALFLGTVVVAAACVVVALVALGVASRNAKRSENARPPADRELAES